MGWRRALLQNIQTSLQERPCRGIVPLFRIELAERFQVASGRRVIWTVNALVDIQYSRIALFRIRAALSLCQMEQRNPQILVQYARGFLELQKEAKNLFRPGGFAHHL